MDQRVHPSNSPLQTRKNYVSTLFAKLGMKQRTQAAAYAARTLNRPGFRRGSIERMIGSWQEGLRTRRR
jgi:hypothetical protein